MPIRQRLLFVIKVDNARRYQPTQRDDVALARRSTEQLLRQCRGVLPTNPQPQHHIDQCPGVTLLTELLIETDQ